MVVKETNNYEAIVKKKTVCSLGMSVHNGSTHQTLYVHTTLEKLEIITITSHFDFMLRKTVTGK